MDDEQPRGGAPLREVIAKSWHRSRLSGVSPDRLAPLYVPDSVREDRFFRAVRPVAQRLGEQFAAQNAAVLVADARAHITERVVGRGKFERGLDKIMLAEGFCYSEELVGTNAIGTALEEGGSSLVVGGEHFADPLRNMACAATPIRDPCTGRLLGVIDITVEGREFSWLMQPLVAQAASDVGRRLLESSSVAERLLLSTFLEATRRSRRPVLVLNERIMMATPNAIDLLGPADHAVLWEAVKRARGTGGVGPSSTIHVGDGRSLSARLKPVVDGGLTVGELLEIEVDRDPRPRRRASPAEPSDGTVPYVRVPHVSRPAVDTGSRLHRGSVNGSRGMTWSLPPLVGDSAMWTSLVGQVLRLAGQGGRLLLAGEPGSGKLAIATALHGLLWSGEPFTVLDAGHCAMEGAGAWLGRAGGLLSSGAGSAATVVVRHAELLDVASARCLADLIDLATGTSGIRLLTTVTTAHPPGVAGNGSAATGPTGAPTASTAVAPGLLPLLDRFPCSVVVPPLRQRREDIPVLVEHVLGPGSCASAVLSALAAQEWPGNARQLVEMLAALQAGHGSREPLVLGDLPLQFRFRPSRMLTVYEQAEYRAIVDALAVCGGNKAHAADWLGISRSGLYRKMESFDIDDRAFDARR